MIGQLKRHGKDLFVVDQPATIGALPIAVAQVEGVLVGYLPGLAMRRIADLYASEAKTDPRDAAIIAQAARSLPHALRPPLQLADEQVAELSMLCGFDDDDGVDQITATGNRSRGLLTQIHPASVPTRKQEPQAGPVSAVAVLCAPLSRAYYDRKTARGKRHNQALVTLARRRCDVLDAMLRYGTLYQADDQLAA